MNIIIGKIVSSHGLKGQVKVYNYSKNKERYEDLDEIIVENRILNIEGVKYKDQMVILKLKGVDDRDAADRLRDKELSIDEKNLKELPEGEYYIRDLIGLNVIDVKTSQSIGTISEVLQNKAQDIYVVSREGLSDVLIPVVSEFVKDVSLTNKCVYVDLIEGFI